MKLQRKAFITVFGLLFVAIAVNTVVLNAVSTTHYREAILMRTEAIGQSLRRDLARAQLLGLELSQIPGLNEKLSEMVSGDDTLGYGLIAGSGGTVLFHSDPARVGEKVTLPADVGGPEKTRVHTTEEYYNIVMPIGTEETPAVATLRLGLTRSTVTAQVIDLTQWALGTATAILLISLVLVYLLISRVITNPVLKMKEAAEQIAAGNLSTEITHGGRDEISALGQAMNKTAEKLRELLAGIKGTAERVSDVARGVKSTAQTVRTVADSQGKSLEEAALSIEAMDGDIASISAGVDTLAVSATETSESMETMSEKLESVAKAVDSSEERAAETAVSVEEMVRNIDAIFESVGHLSDSFDEITVSVTELDATVNEINGRAGESVELAEEVDRNASGKGRQAVDAAGDGMKDVKDVMESMTQVVHSLGERSADIGKILDVIRSVTDQTGLLSLNAAILAAQAGEHGKAFSVVATEIGTLAEKTAASTTSIEEIVLAVQSDIASSVDRSGRGIDLVENGMKRVDDVRTAFNDIAESSQRSTNMARAIQRATSEQASGIRNIRKAIEDVQEMQIKQIVQATEEQSQGSRLVVEANEDLKEMLAQIRASTASQRASGRQIADAMARVSKEIDGIAGATSGLRNRSQDVVRFTNGVLKATDDLLSSADGMGGTVSRLEGETDTLHDALAKIEFVPAK